VPIHRAGPSDLAKRYSLDSDSLGESDAAAGSWDERIRSLPEADAAYVISEPMKPHGDPIVRSGLDRQDPATLYLASTSLAEWLLGLELLPNSRRKHGLAAALNELLSGPFGSRILAFDQHAAIEYARLVGRARARRQAVPVADAQIAAIASNRTFAVATRDTVPFSALGVSLIDPWSEH